MEHQYEEIFLELKPMLEKASNQDSLRDYFAALAMQGAVADGGEDPYGVARFAYEVADAMLETRGK